MPGTKVVEDFVPVDRITFLTTRVETRRALASEKDVAVGDRYVKHGGSNYRGARIKLKHCKYRWIKFPIQVDQINLS